MVIEIVKGMAFTLRQLFRKPITLQWPEEQKPAPARHRGRHILHRYDNGLERCIGCELCSGACPVGCIYVEPAENDPANPVSPGERYARTEAITLGPRFELADYRRERTVATKEDLLEAWPNFAAARGPNPRGAGADQRGQAARAPGVSPRLAWDEDELIRREGGERTVPGNAGLAPHVPSVAEPRHHKRDR